MTSSPLTVVIDALAPTGYTVITGRLPDNVSKLTVVIGLGDMVPGPPQGQLTWKVPVVVLSALKDEKAERDLEAAVLTVVGALNRADLIALTGGSRGTAGDQAYNSFALEVEVYTPIT